MDWRRVPDWGGEPPQQKGGGEGGWGQSPVGGARSASSKHGKPPPSPGSWQPAVPSWEKRFCTAVCRIPWGKICETRRLMSYYSNVINWDDSAGKEAFDNAKTRFFSEINGLPCDIPLPGPDIYIDDVDWESEVDPQLLLELDTELLPADVEAKDSKTCFLSSGWDRAIPCTGWGDAEDISSAVRDGPAGTVLANFGEDGGQVDGWDCSREWQDGRVDTMRWGARAQDYDSGWGGGAWEDNTGWGTGTWEDKSGWGGAAGGWEDDLRLRDGVWEKSSATNERHNKSFRQQDGNRNSQTGYWESRRYSRKRDGDGLCGWRSPAFARQRDGSHQPRYNNNNWRNSRGRKRESYQNEPLVPGRPSACGLRT